MWGQCDSIFTAFTLISLYYLLEEKYLKSFHHKLLEAVIEEKQGEFLVGTTQNYIKVYIDCACESLINTIQKVKIGKIFQDGVVGKIVE
jgi:tRNA A37 methylthiotransferase MiaB